MEMDGKERDQDVRLRLYIPGWYTFPNIYH